MTESYSPLCYHTVCNNALLKLNFILFPVYKYNVISAAMVEQAFITISPIFTAVGLWGGGMNQGCEESSQLLCKMSKQQ